MRPSRAGATAPGAGLPLAVTAVLTVPIAAAALAVRRLLAPDGVVADDAYIFLRYGRNLAGGLGWVWNPGGPPVEGTTSTLWTLISAAGFRLSAQPEALLFAVAVTAVTLALALWVTVVLTADAIATRADEPLPIGGALLVTLAIGLDLAVRPAFSFWTAASLMDGGIWCAATLFAAATLARAAVRVPSRSAQLSAALAQVALALARPEALVVGPLFVAAAALARPAPARRWLAPLGGAFLAQAGLLAWRLATFGWPLPNTYYAKVGDDLGQRVTGGLRYLLAAAGDDPTRLPLWLLAAAVLAVALRRRHAAKREEAPAAEPVWTLAAAGTLAGPVVVLFEGGDHFGGFRPLVQLRPFETTLAVLVLAHAFARRYAPRRARALVAAAVSALALGRYALEPARWSDLARTTGLDREIQIARGQLALGRTLNALFGRETSPPTVGVIAAGALPYLYRGRSVDLMGLNDTAMAHATRRRAGVYGHAGFSAEAFFAAPPDLLVVTDGSCSASGRAAERLVVRLALADVARDPRFAAVFERVRLSGAGMANGSLCLYARRAWVASVAERRTGFSFVELDGLPRLSS